MRGQAYDGRVLASLAIVIDCASSDGYRVKSGMTGQADELDATAGTATA